MRADIRAATGAALLVLMALVGPGVALAGNFTVDASEDGGDFDRNDGVCDADPSPATKCTFRAALEQANQDGSGTITVPAGTYQAYHRDAGGGIQVTGAITVTGAGADTTLITTELQGAGSGSLTMSGVTIQPSPGGIGIEGRMTLKDVVIQGGDTGILVAGGAGATPSVLEQVRVRGSGAGGGIRQRFPGFVRLTEVIVESCNGGDGISLDGPGNLDKITVTGCLSGIGLINSNLSEFSVSGNTGAGLILDDSEATNGEVSGNGLGVVLTRSKLTRVTVSGNRATGPGSVGGVIAQGGAPATADGVTNTLTTVTITGNSGETGGLLNRGGGTQTLIRNSSTISNNTGSAAGGIFNDFDAKLGIVNSAVRGNTSTRDAGGIANFGPELLLTSAVIEENQAARNGGGILNQGATIRLAAVSAQIKANRAARGAGIYNEAGSVSLDGGTLDRNIAPSNSVAGGLHSESGLVSADNTEFVGNSGIALHAVSGKIDLQDVQIQNNTGVAVLSGSNGDVVTTPLSEAIITNSLVLGNNGGIAARGRSGSTVEVRNSTIQGNNNTGGAGSAQQPAAGGISNAAGNRLTVTDSSIVGNSGATGGIVNAGTAILTRVTISGNSGTVGGFQQAAVGNAATALAAVTISGNTGSGGPGGLQALAQVGLTGVTVASNTGVGLGSNPNAARLRSTLLASNSGGDCQGTPASLGRNLSSDATCALSASLGDLIGVNPLLSPLGGPSGSPQTHALAPNSPAIDAGDNTECARTPLDGNGDGTAVCDIGAFEAPAAQGPAGCSPRTAVVVAVVPNGDGRLKATVTAGVGTIQKIEFGAATNALVLPPGATTGTAGNFTFTPPTPVATVTFLVSRPTAGEGSTVRLTVHDTCGPWPTFVGGGPAAF